MNAPAAITVRRASFGLRGKLVIGFSLIFTLTFVATFYWFYLFSTERAVASIVDDMTQTVLGVSAGLDGTLMRELFSEGQPNEAGGSDHPNYVTLMDYLATVQRLEPQAWPYLYVPGDEPNQYFALADLWLPIAPDKSFTFMEMGFSTGFLSGGFDRLTVNVSRERRCNALRAPEDAGVIQRLQGELQRQICFVLRRVGYTDAFGSWVSAYAPVVGADGTLFGAVGLDFEMAYVDDIQNAVLRNTWIAFLVTIPTLLLVVMVAAGVFARPIRRLTEVAARVGEGDYTVTFDALKQRRFRDEIGVLAEVFEAMTTKIRGREAALRQTVMELRVEIDEAKRAQEVQAIVDTDFFRDLQAKAVQMRERRTRVSTSSSGTKVNSKDAGETKPDPQG